MPDTVLYDVDGSVASITLNRPESRNSLNTEMKTALLATAVLKAPWGAHPFSSPGFYVEDRAHIAELAAAGRACARGVSSHAVPNVHWRPTTSADSG